jgi:hypothetical protein
MGTNTQYLNTSIRRQYSKTGQTRFSKYPKTSIRILVQILVSGGCQTGPKSPLITSCPRRLVLGTIVLLNYVSNVE